MLLGARVIAAASSEEKLALCRERGAAETIDYTRENLKERAKALTGGNGAHVLDVQWALVDLGLDMDRRAASWDAQ